MCWLCDHPGATRLDYLDHLRDLVASYGWAVQRVERDGLHPPFAYTVGLTAAGRPELVATGLSQRRAAQLLNDVASHALHATAPKPGQRIPLIGGPLIEIVEIPEPTAHADDRGHWPWEVGYRGTQRVLGIRASARAA